MVGRAVIGPVIRSHLTVAEEQTVRGELLAGGRLTLRGQATGAIRVDDGGQLTVHGQLCGELVVAAGGSARLHGQINGVIRNEGWVRVSGSIGGRVLQNTGVIEVAAGAMINKHGRFLLLRADGSLGAFRGSEPPDSAGGDHWLTYQPGCRFIPDQPDQGA
jgi:hypothetical protein